MNRSRYPSGTSGHASTSLRTPNPRWEKAESAARVVAIAGFPLSLHSAGATISLALTALFGLALLLRDRDFPRDLSAVHYKLLPLYMLIVAVELINGGSWFSLASTAFNYLPLLALAPYAYALRKLDLRAGEFDRAIWATVALGATISIAIAILLGDRRPGGPDMDALSYGYVLAVWLFFVFSSALENRETSIPLLVLSAVCVAVLLYAKTKIVVFCVIAGFLLIGVIWAMQRGRWRTLFLGIALSIVPFALAVYYLVWPRALEFVYALQLYVEKGIVVSDESFALRLEQIIAGYKSALERPILGHGLAETGDAIYRNLTSGADYRRLIIHNDYIVHMVAFGVFGLIFLLGYFAAAFLIVHRARDAAHRRAGLALVATMPFFMATYIVFNMSPMSGLVALAMGVVLATPPEPAREQALSA